MTRLAERSEALLFRLATAIALFLAMAAVQACERSGESAAAPESAIAASSVAAGSDEGMRVSATQDPGHAGRLAETFDAYRSILANCVTEEGLVLYDMLAEEPARSQLRQVVAGFAEATGPKDSGRHAEMAFLCNAYNANALQMTLDARNKEDFSGVNSLTGFFDTVSLQVAGEWLSLAALRDRIAALGDPRVHAALVHGAMGCPPLRNEPFEHERLNEQLNGQCRRWLDDQRRNRAARTSIVLSSVFRERAADFDVAPYEGVIGFVRKHSRPNGSLRDFIRNVQDVRIEYAPFDWSINDAARGSGDNGTDP